MIIMNSKYYPPFIASTEDYPNNIILSTVSMTGLFCETAYSIGGHLLNSSITYVNNDGSMSTIEV